MHTTVVAQRRQALRHGSLVGSIPPHLSKWRNRHSRPEPEYSGAGNLDGVSALYCEFAFPESSLCRASHTLTKLPLVHSSERLQLPEVYEGQQLQFAADALHHEPDISYLRGCTPTMSAVGVIGCLVVRSGRSVRLAANTDPAVVAPRPSGREATQASQRASQRHCRVLARSFFRGARSCRLRWR
jgi:hypothetical protein